MPLQNKNILQTSYPKSLSQKLFTFSDIYDKIKDVIYG